MRQQYHVRLYLVCTLINKNERVVSLTVPSIQPVISFSSEPAHHPPPHPYWCEVSASLQNRELPGKVGAISSLVAPEHTFELLR